MKKNIIKALVGILLIVSLMCTEYRYIMCNLKPYRAENGIVYIEMFGNIDEYYADFMYNYK